MPGRGGRRAAALLAMVALATLPGTARGQDEPAGGTQLPAPTQNELPEVKVEAPRVEPPKPPPKPAVVPKPTRRRGTGRAASRRSAQAESGPKASCRTGADC